MSEILEYGLAFDDVLLVPRYSSIESRFSIAAPLFKPLAHRVTGTNQLEWEFQ